MRCNPRSVYLQVASGMIDHVLVSSGRKARKAWIEYHMKEKMVPSDHWPVAAVIEPAK